MKGAVLLPPLSHKASAGRSQCVELQSGTKYNKRMFLKDALLAVARMVLLSPPFQCGEIGRESRMRDCEMPIRAN